MTRPRPNAAMNGPTTDGNGCRAACLSLALLLLAVPHCLRASDEAEAAVADGEWTRLAYLRKPEGNLTFTTRWVPGGTVHLMVRERGSGRQVLLQLGSGNVFAWLRQEGQTRNGDWERLEPVARRLANAPQEPIRHARFLVKFRRDDWQVYVEQRLLCKLPAPFSPPTTVFVPTEEAPWLGEKRRYQAVAAENFHSDFMIEEGAPNQLYPWVPGTGEWHIHTAMDDALTRPESDVNRIKQVPLTADKSPNFYCLKGKGSHAVLKTGFPFYDDYELAAAVQVNEGEAGIVFYHQDAEDYYAFTLEVRPADEDDGRLRLWRVRQAKRELLAMVRTSLFTRQWYMPKIRVGTDRIHCYLDNIEVASVAETLPPGGAIGLYANTEAEVRFDDVKLDGTDALHLRDVEHIRFYTLVHEGRFYRAPSRFRRGTAPDREFLRPAVSRRPQRLVLGNPTHRGAVFSAQFKPAAPQADVGLIAGYRGEGEPYYRFRCARATGVQTYVLEQVTDGRSTALQSWSAPGTGSGTAGGPLLLMSDASTPGELRLYHDGRLVLVTDVEGSLTGACGLFVGPRTETTVGDLAYTFARQDSFKEQAQENQVFQQDPFMRHWAAPEGQWVKGEGDFMWHKSDFFGRFDIRLPLVAGAELHVGVEEGSLNGHAILKVGEAGLSLSVGADSEAPDTVLEAEVKQGEWEEEAPAFTLYGEDYWLWVKVRDETVLRYRLPLPLQGTRVRVHGYTTAHLAQGFVNRYMVKDDLFTEAPYEWVVNGGDWQIVNRFQCTPSWSHMAGQSNTGMAALWHKYVYGGDFCLEFYAGTRHGWYDRVGDLNCTAMASATAPDSGYTVTCTEWDQNLSQNWSTFRRKGRAVARSDAYLMPRRRKGSVRKYLNPLLSAGRPVHGAWYYIKLRRIGSKLEYFFDNELVFSYDDPEPIPEGMIGIWTFLHSMTLARIKVSFREARPRPFSFEALPLPEAVADTAEPPPTPPEHFDLRLCGQPLESLRPELWSVDDDVGHPERIPRKMNAATLGLRNRLGSGNMRLSAALTPVPLNRLAGWRFHLKRSGTARLNFHYSIGTLDDKGTFTATRKLFHHISATDFADGAYDMTGATRVPPSERPFVQGGDWHLVPVWIPTRVRGGGEADSALHVRVEGFGHLQPSEAMAGIGGDPPGAGYMVRQLTPVFYGVPDIALAEGSPVPGSFVVLDRPSGREWFRCATAGDVQGRLSETPRVGLNTCWLQVRNGEGSGFSHYLAWIHAPEAAQWELGWDSELPGTVRLRSTSGFPDPRFALAAVTLGGAPLDLVAGNDESRYATIPRTAATVRSASPTLAFSVDAGSGPTAVELRWADVPRQEPPALLALDGLTPFCATFEDRAHYARQTDVDANRHRISSFDPDQGSWLTVRNRDLNQRLSSSFSIDFPISRFPLMQFRYRAFDMAYLTASFKGGYYVRLNDDYSAAVQTRLSHDLKLDEQWHSWLGVVTDGFVLEPFTVARFRVPALTLGSAGSPDQTGRYSRWDLDDVVFGPAVSKAEQLAFTPQYFDADGVAAVAVAVSPGPLPFADLSPEGRDALTWQTHEPGASVTPAIDGLADGVHHVFLKATDAAGQESAVTDVPFLLDTSPLVPTPVFEAMPHPSSNGVQLRVAFDNGGGAPWQIGEAQFQVAGTKTAVPAWTNSFVHSPGADSLILNYPFLFRTLLDSANDGDTLEFGIDGIIDGAGNVSPRLAVPFKVDYASDKTGPAWYMLKFGGSVHWFFNWDGYYDGSYAFSVAQYNQISVVHAVGQTAYLQTGTYQATGDIYHNVNWKPATHPWLSFRLCLPAARAATVVNAVLATNQGTYTLSLQKPATAATELNRTETIAWQANVWKRLSFNVRDQLRAAGVAEDKLQALVVTTLHFRRGSASHAELLQLDDVFLHTATPDEAMKDTLTWYAYDASGIASLEIEYHDEQDKVLWRESLPSPTADLRPLRPKAVGRGWLMCQAKDKAGNLSVPFWLPLPKE